MQALFVERPAYQALKRFYSFVTKSMVENSIVGDVLTHMPLGISQAKIVYQPKDKEVYLGNELTPTDAQAQPCVEWAAGGDKFYTIIMIDPDAPNRKDPKFREWLHWAVGNIPGMCVGNGVVLAPYIGPWPPEGSERHRYVFFIYEQRGKIDFCGRKLKGVTAKGRSGFCTEGFVDRHNLRNPVAANYFYAKCDDYAKKLAKKLGL